MVVHGTFLCHILNTNTIKIGGREKKTIKKCPLGKLIFCRYTYMVILTTTTDLQTIKLIPREFATSDVKIDLTDDITGDVLSSGETSTFTRTGDYITASVGFTGLKEDRFYTLRYVKILSYLNPNPLI